MICHEFQPIYGTVLKRPSIQCKSPYVADVEIGEESIMGHTPALGCCGLADKGATVILSKLPPGKTKTSHRIELSIQYEKDREIVIGINPKLGESIAENVLKNNYILGLSNIRSYTRETTVLTSRFDFTGIDETGCPFIMEVKSVPLADYVDVPKKDRKKYDGVEKTKKYNEKIAYFPDGYRKNSTDVVSPRALKHVQELENISKTSRTRAILCFIVQREDACCFQPSNIDLTYKKAVQQAWLNGVEIKTIQVRWNKRGECSFMRNDMPIYLFEKEGPHRLND
jgi:DNA-binding sugar fermentation-stimulating protein